MQLRPYQELMITRVMEAFQEHQRTLVCAPTGTGKTVVFTHLIDRYCTNGDRALIVAHKDELIRQAFDKVRTVTQEEPGVEKAGDYTDNGASMYGHIDKPRVVVTSVQTQNSKRGQGRRMERLDPKEFKLLIIDEAHHAVADTYQRLIDYYTSYNPDCKVVGFTATPDRADEKALGQVFTSVAVDYQLKRAIHDGWLVPIKQQFMEVSLDLSSVGTVAGDLNQGQLAKVIEDEQLMHEMVGPTIEAAAGRQVIFFAVTVAQANRIAEIFNRHGDGEAFVISAKTPEVDRRSYVKRFTDGDLRYFVNVGIATEGFDCSAPVIAMGRPTKSRALYAQCIGRGTRPDPSCLDELHAVPKGEDRREVIERSVKPHMLVLDYVGNSGRHKLVHTGDILGEQYDDEVVREAHRRVREKGGEADMREELIAAAEELSGTAARKRRQVKIKADWKSREVDPFDVFGMDTPKPRGWHIGRPASPRQIDALRKFKVDDARIEQMDFTQASATLDMLITRAKAGYCSYAQAKLLAKFGLNVRMTFKQASATIDRIARNRWRVPEDLLR